jgi:hypothetical protein
MGEGLQNPDLNLNRLYDQAGQAMPDFAEFGQNFLQYLQEKHPEQFAGVEFQHAPIKDLERIQDKVTGDYGGDHTRVADMVRGRLLVETPEQIQIVRNEIAALQENLGIVKVKDFYAEPLKTHFRTLNTQVRLPNGHVAEFRIDQHDMALAGEEAHKLYEEIQEIERTAKAENRSLTENEIIRRNELYEEQRTIFHDPAQKNNLDSLLNEKGAAILEADRNGRLQGLADTFGDLGKNGGLVTGVVMGGLVGAFTLAATGDSAQAAEAVYETAVPYGETQFDLATGDLEAAAKSATIETASNIGSVGGAAAGALAGAALGSVVPEVGTAVGGVVGGIVGAVGGGVAVGEATEFVYDHAADIADWWDEGDDELLARLPTEIDESAPPELQHLVEIKRILTEAQSERKSLGYGRTRDSDLQNDRRDLTGKIERIEQMYDEAYDTYEDSGALGTAIASLCDWERAEQVAQQAIENMQRDIPEHEASYGQTSSALAFSK